MKQTMNSISFLDNLPYPKVELKKLAKTQMTKSKKIILNSISFLDNLPVPGDKLRKQDKK